MIVELRGVEFVNKGAELMLYAIMSKLREHNSNIIFVIEKSSRTPIAKQRQLGIYTKLNFRRYKINTKKIGPLVPKFIRRKLKYILEEEINVILDASGFAFGDQWGAEYAEKRLGNKIKKWKKDGKTVILLPQAFGPFENQELVKSMSKIIENAEIIFARDRVSFDYLKGLSKDSKIMLAPDFTNLVEGKTSSVFDTRFHQIGIIPNYKMFSANPEETTNAYFDFLKRTIELIQKRHALPFFLIHEGTKDIAIAKKVNKRLGNPIPIVAVENPLEIKGIIGQSKAIITSRFHGLVSALSQSVPCLATGWSHKYVMLLEDYKYKEGLLNVNCDEVELVTKIDSILDAMNNKNIRHKLGKESELQKERSLNMWDIVLNKINY